MRAAAGLLAGVLSVAAVVRGTLALAEVGGWWRFGAAVALCVAVVPLAVALSYNEPDDGIEARTGHHSRSRGRCRR